MKTRNRMYWGEIQEILMDCGGKPNYETKQWIKEIQKRMEREPEKVVLVLQSRWWIVRMWRKFWKTEKKISNWKYTVKFIEDGTDEKDDPNLEGEER